MVEKRGSEIFMFYNTENFYPPDNDTFGRSSLRNWDQYKYQLKLRKIAQVFDLISQYYGCKPSVIGLAEIGDISVLEDLLRQDSVVKGYGIIYEKSADPRNLSVAMLYDQSVFSLANYQVLRLQHTDYQNFETRDILHVKIIYMGKPLHIFILHLPSKRERDIKQGLRHQILGQLKEIVQAIMEKQEAVMVMGDFNEDPNSDILEKFLSFEDEEKALFNPFLKLFEQSKYSTFHGKKGLGFDQIMISNDFSNLLGFRSTEATIYSSEKLRNKDRKNKQFPLRTYSGSRYMGGYSDHFPVILQTL